MNEPVWFRQHRDDGDRFARALEGHGSARPERPPVDADAEFADELALVNLLHDLGSDPALDLEQPRKDRMRAALMAEAGSIAVAEPEVVQPIRIPTQRRTSPAQHTRRKASLLAAATAAGIVAFGALGIELAQNALPGDLLYDIKRTTESIALDLTFSQDGKALKRLEMASTRVQELAALAERDAADGGATLDDLGAYRAVLYDLNTTVVAASRAVTSYGPQSDGNDLRKLRDWSRVHSAQLAAIRSAVPEAVVHEFDATVDLIGQVEQRASALLERLRCEQITSGRSDGLGAVPAVDECVASESITEESVLPRVSAKPKSSDKDATADSQQAPADTGSDTAAPPPADDPAAPPAEVDVPGLPEAPNAPVDQAPDTEKDAKLTEVPMITELPEIDLGID